MSDQERIKLLEVRLADCESRLRLLPNHLSRNFVPVIKLDDDDGVAFLVSISAGSGSLGDESTACSAVYTVKDITGTTTLGTSVAVETPRGIGLKKYYVGLGWARHDSGTLKIVGFLADERDDVDTCSGDISGGF